MRFVYLDESGISVNEPVTVTLDAFVYGIPPGSFSRHGEAFRFDRDDFPGVRRVTIERDQGSDGKESRTDRKDLHGVQRKTFDDDREFEVILDNIDLTRINFDRPVRFRLRIGDDTL